jgi:hypothetical protein
MGRCVESMGESLVEVVSISTVSWWSIGWALWLGGRVVVGWALRWDLSWAISWCLSGISRMNASIILSNFSSCLASLICWVRIISIIWSFCFSNLSAIDSAPDLLATIFGQWDVPPPNTPPSRPTPSRKRTCNSPNQTTLNKDPDSPDDDSTLDEDDEDNDDDIDDEDIDDEEYRPSDDLSSEHSDDMQDTDFIAKSELQDEDEDPDLMLSQTAASEYKQIEFFVESNHPERKEEFLILLKHFKSTQEDPTALRTHIRSWTNDNNE